MNSYRQRPFDERRGGGPPQRPTFGQGRQEPLKLPDNYLKDGYFDAKGNMRPELVGGQESLAAKVARLLGQRQGQAELKSAQLRRFYGKAKSVEQKLDAGQDFESLKAEILTLQPIAANTVARGNATGLLKDFIDLNVSEAVKDEKHFRKGFLVHFQSVVAYFTYFNK